MILNEMQKEVVYSDEQFLFLLAGAGSGKTRVIIERIKVLIEKGVQAEGILALTFTNKAANEMKERIHNPDIHVHTFHQYCYQMLKVNSHYPYQIFDAKNFDFTRTELLDIANYKNSLYLIKKPKIYTRYTQILKEKKTKDFDDMLIDFISFIKSQPSIANYPYIFIDEFQDTNLLQYEVLRKIIKKDTHVLCVGDPDQSIYKFRGADSKIIERYVKDYQAKIKYLTINYRSNQTIINHANRLIKRNYRVYKKDLLPFIKETNHIESYNFMDQTSESEQVFLWITNWIKLGAKPEEVGILFREHQRSYDLKHHLSDQLVDENHQIQMLTIHQAKGLEFEYVVILGLEAHTFPSCRKNQRQLLEEERRLMFVAMTRAKQKLIFTHVKYDTYFQRQQPSMFIKEAGIKSKIFKL